MASAFLEHGVEAEALRKTCRPTRRDAQRYSDAGDVAILGTRWTVEVKSRRQKFCADPSSYPFRRVLVDSAHAVRKMGRHTAAIVIVSQLTGAMVVVPMSTRRAWFDGSIDTLDGAKAAKFVARKHLRRFCELALWLSCQASQNPAR